MNINVIFPLDKPITGFSNQNGFTAKQLHISTPLLEDGVTRGLRLTILPEKWENGNCSIVIPMSEMPKIIDYLIWQMSEPEHLNTLRVLKKYVTKQ